MCVCVSVCGLSALRQELQDAHDALQQSPEWSPEPPALARVLFDDDRSFGIDDDETRSDTH